LDVNLTFGVFFMTKYNEAIRRQIVDEYFTGSSGYKSVAKKWGIGPTTLRRWIYGYRVHGQQGLSKKHSIYSADFKLQVLKRMWRDELSYAQVSAMFNLRESSGVSRWERQYHEGGYDALKPRPKGRRPKMPDIKPISNQDAARAPDERTRQELLDENEYLRAEVAYLKKLQELRREKALAAKPAKQRKS
jgi:transposase